MAFQQSDGAGDKTGVNTPDGLSPGLLAKLMVGAIRLYQKTLSRSFPPSCRFYPSCSQYTLEAIVKYGPFKGGWMGAKRIMCCHPLHPGGYDPVP
jgi:uncharacterized protein